MKKITIEHYPATFSFNTRAKLPKFNRNSYSCKVRQKLLLKNLKKFNIDSPCHAYEDYVVELVHKTSNGEIWRLGS